MNGLLQDLRFAFRVLTRNPSLAVTAAITLALGIGATTAIFSVVRGVLIRPLPYEQPDRLVRLFWSRSATHDDRLWISLPDFLDYRAQARLIRDVSASWGDYFNVTGNGD